jgi:hypothetical protein
MAGLGAGDRADNAVDDQQLDEFLHEDDRTFFDERVLPAVREDGRGGGELQPPPPPRATIVCP